MRIMTMMTRYKVPVEISEYLVFVNGLWFIARPGAVPYPMREDPSGSTMKITLCWVGRNDEIICLAGDEDEVREMPS